jgi:PHD/YefM family antitoxin component YafN of YafNO toxin-antitoxin module
MLNEVHGGNTRVIVEKDGVPVAGVISVADLERLQLMEDERERNFGVLDNIRAAFEGVSDEELEQEVEKALQAIRAERQAPRSTE